MAEDFLEMVMRLFIFTLLVAACSETGAVQETPVGEHLRREKGFASPKHSSEPVKKPGQDKNSRANPGSAFRTKATSRESASQLASQLEYRGQLGQDKWILESVFPGVTRGYFLDVGSGDGVDISNSKALEDKGWTGICVDPFPKNMKTRTCQIFKEVVYSKAGKKIEFRTAGDYGGIDKHIIRYRQSLRVITAGTVSLMTVTLGSILKRAKAPKFIHYMNLDIEGAELEAMKAFPFSRYKVGAITVEHNFVEPKRSKLKKLLQDNGYRLAKSLKWDDWYVLDECRGPNNCCLCKDKSFD